VSPWSRSALPDGAHRATWATTLVTVRARLHRDASAGHGEQP